MSDEEKVIKPFREIATELAKENKGIIMIGDLNNTTRAVVYGAKAFAEDMCYKDSLAYRLTHSKPDIKKIFRGEKDE